MGSPSPTRPSNRKPLHERTQSETNASALAAVRLVPPTPPRLLGCGGTEAGLEFGSVIGEAATTTTTTLATTRDEVYSRTPLPTHPSHVLSPGGGDEKGSAEAASLLEPPGYALTQSSGASDDVSAFHLRPHPVKQPWLLVRDKNYTDKTGVSKTSVSTDINLHNAPTAISPPTSPSSTRSLPRPVSKRRKHVKVNPDKTFSVLDLVQAGEGSNASEGGLKSPSSRTSQLSHDQQSSDTQEIAGGQASPLSFLPAGSSAATTPTTPAFKSPTPKISDDTNSSPWNYRLVAGLRKVPTTPDFKGKVTALSDTPIPELPQPSSNPAHAQELVAKPSFHSSISATSSTSGETNYQVYGTSPTPFSPLNAPLSTHPDYNVQLSSHAPESDLDTVPNYEVFGTSPALNLAPLPPPSSPPDFENLEQSSPISHIEDQSSDTPTSPDGSNYQILGQSSPAISDIDLALTNYELHGDTSTSSSVAFAKPLRAAYSRESLVVLPLQPRAQRSFERFGYYKSRSRESLRSSSLTSISTVLSQEAAQAIVATGALIHVSRSPSPGSWVDPLVLNRVRCHMQAHPHQWSSQLSTVPSVSEGGTDRGSRSLSEISNQRRSSGFPSIPSRHSRQRASISSSLEERQNDTEMLERPQPVFARTAFRDATGSTVRMVEDQDEHGDGITDMLDLRQRPSRNKMSGLFSSASSDNGRSDTMRSTSSSRANSLLNSGIPTWARLYYGGGERRFLMAQPSIESLHLRPNTSFREGSPDESSYPPNIYHPRKRPRNNKFDQRRPSDHESMNIHPATPPQIIHNSFTRRFRRPSSVWSPHLHRQVCRATRSSIWEPPSVNFSTESGVFGRRNIQVVMFIMGFIFPFAWMIAAFLPLPENPVFVMHQRDHSDLDMSSDIARQMHPMDEARYESAKWWRNLNRGMAVVGLAIVILLVVLVLIGTRHQWVH